MSPELDSSGNRRFELGEEIQLRKVFRESSSDLGQSACDRRGGEGKVMGEVEVDLADGVVLRRAELKKSAQMI